MVTQTKAATLGINFSLLEASIYLSNSATRDVDTLGLKSSVGRLP